MTTGLQSQRLVSQPLSRAQILAGIFRNPNDHLAPILLILLLVGHLPSEADGEKNGAEIQAQESEIGETPGTRLRAWEYLEASLPADGEGLQQVVHQADQPGADSS